MKVSIFSREGFQKYIPEEGIADAAVISFHDTDGKGLDKQYTDKLSHFLEVAVDDIEEDELEQYGLNGDSFFPEADSIAEFIRENMAKGLSIICQCEYGQSRSAACAAAILEYYAHRGIDIFADPAYWPNKAIYKRLITALRKEEK